jgi:hypothetical protein
MVSIENIDGYMEFVYEGWMTKLSLDKGGYADDIFIF